MPANLTFKVGYYPYQEKSVRLSDQVDVRSKRRGLGLWRYHDVFLDMKGAL